MENKVLWKKTIFLWQNKFFLWKKWQNKFFLWKKCFANKYNIQKSDNFLKKGVTF